MSTFVSNLTFPELVAMLDHLPNVASRFAESEQTKLRERLEGEIVTRYNRLSSGQ